MSVNRIIRARKTSKLMLAPEKIAEAKALWTPEHHQTLKQMIEGAAWAPFHRRASEQSHRQGQLNAVMPWRFHVLEGQACIELVSFLEQQAQSESDPKWARAWQSKIKNMLAACGALVQVTWLPDPDESEHEQAAMSLNNIEHIAAASAAVQNLLLAAEARAWASYWSSGGILRDPDVFAHLGIDKSQALLGSIFLTPHIHDQTIHKMGGLREERGDLGDWARWL